MSKYRGHRPFRNTLQKWLNFYDPNLVKAAIVALFIEPDPSINFSSMIWSQFKHMIITSLGLKGSKLAPVYFACSKMRGVPCILLVLSKKEISYVFSIVTCAL